ncbi:hypothetical protein OG497_37720 [Streptomyces sp. NBC_01242]|uniref:hypothetical protein n=1 Tax=Streptomyces sp. NBC_01242 TaxID=2903795 RepID=UPI0022550E32|nr:hypothetical protein [Streptomyces sp. NBC_01242]MCX4799597.1 hypothetical protein [Streptomyces sp. NBC_01242]
MADKLTRRAVTQRITQEQEAMAKEATYLKRELERFAADIIKGGSYAGWAQNIANEAVALAVRAAAYDAAKDVASIAIPDIDSTPIEGM